MKMKTKQGKSKITRMHYEQHNDNISVNKGNETSFNNRGKSSFKTPGKKAKLDKKSDLGNLSSQNTNRKQIFKSKFKKSSLQLENNNKASSTNPQVKHKNKKIPVNVKCSKPNSVNGNVNSEDESSSETKETFETSQNGKQDATAGKRPRRQNKNAQNVNVNQHEKVLNFEDTKMKKRFFYRTLLVGNLPPNVEKDQLLKLFSKYGKILHVVLKNPKSESKTTLLQSFIVFQKRQEALKVLEDSDIKYKGHDLQVQLCDSSKYDQNKAIVVTNLSADTESNDLWTAFGSFGPILNVHLLRNKKKIVAGTGYINFESASSVALALKMENVVIKNRFVTIKEQKFSENKGKKKHRKRKDSKRKRSVNETSNVNK